MRCRSVRLSMFRAHRWEPLCLISQTEWIEEGLLYNISHLKSIDAALFLFKPSLCCTKTKQVHNCKNRAFFLKTFGHKGRRHSGSQPPSQSNMRTHNDGRVVTGIEGTLMQIDPQRPKCHSLLIKLFTTPWMVSAVHGGIPTDSRKRVNCRHCCAAVQCENFPINEMKKDNTENSLKSH